MLKMNGLKEFLSSKKAMYIIATILILIFAVVFFFFKRKKAPVKAKKVPIGTVISEKSLRKPHNNKSAITNSDITNVDALIFRDKGYSGMTLDEIKALAKANLRKKIDEEIAQGKRNADGELIDENGYVLV